MDYELRIVIEKVAVSSQEVVKRDTIKIYDIQRPESILDLGLRHSEQISLLSKVQNTLLRPECGWQSASTIKSLFGTNIHPDEREIAM